MISHFAFWCSRKDEHRRIVFSLVWFVRLIVFCVRCATYAQGNFIRKICAKYAQIRLSLVNAQHLCKIYFFDQCAIYGQDFRKVYFFCQCTIYGQDLRKIYFFVNVQDMCKILLLLLMRKILLLLADLESLSDFIFLSVQCKLYSKNEKNQSRNSIDFSIRLPRHLTFITSFVKVQDLTSLVEV